MQEGMTVGEINVEQRVWTNSAAGYLRSVCRPVLGLVSFRLLCTELSIEELGFYSLVWSFLGYGVLLDLGMGVAVQKRTAELFRRQAWPELGSVLSSVLFCNCLWGFVIVALGYFGTDALLRVIGASPANHANFRSALRVFALGMGVLIPLEMFREVHYGLQRIAFAERTITISGIVSFVLLVIALRMHWGLAIVLTLQMGCLVLTDCVLAASALQAMPAVRLGMRHVSWSTLRSMARFSALAYIVVFAGVLVLQTDRFMISAILSVSVVATYHIGAKVPEIFSSFTKQLPDALAPAAATLHDAGHRANWQQLFLRGMRVNALITTPLFFLCFVFLEGMLGVLTRGRASGPEVVWLGRLLLVWSYSTILTHGVAKAIFLMSGHEVRLVRLLVVEALGNIVLSFILLHWLKSPIGAALGSLVPALAIGWGFLWPWIAREIDMTSVALARQVVFPSLLATIPLVVFGLSCRMIPALDFRTSILMFFIDGCVGVVLVAMSMWKISLTPSERGFIIRWVKSRWRRNPDVCPGTDVDVPS